MLLPGLRGLMLLPGVEGVWRSRFRLTRAEAAGTAMVVVCAGAAAGNL